MSEKYYSGVLGWVIVLDEQTESVAKKLALSFYPEAEYRVKTPHITLYHAPLIRVPESEIILQIKGLVQYVARKLNFYDISPYGGKFLFWDVKNKEKIYRLHTHLVDKYSTYLTKKVNVPAEKEKLQMTGEEFENISKYGHPLVKKLFRPHITLAYKTEGINKKDKQKHSGIISAIQFVEIGEYGSIKNVLFSTKEQ